MSNTTNASPGGETVTVTNDIEWRYDIHKAPRGSKVFLLTEGGIAVEGQWKDNGGFIAWHPLFKRNRAKEEAMQQARAEAERKAKAEKEGTITVDAQALYAIFNRALNTTEPHHPKYAWAFAVADKLEKMSGTIELRPAQE